MSRQAHSIETSFVYPPIPDRRFDWLATFRSYEPGDLMGHGPTEVCAIADLLQQEEELGYCRCGEALHSEKEQRDGVCRGCL